MNLIVLFLYIYIDVLLFNFWIVSIQTSCRRPCKAGRRRHNFKYKWRKGRWSRVNEANNGQENKLGSVGTHRGRMGGNRPRNRNSQSENSGNKVVPETVPESNTNKKVAGHNTVDNGGNHNGGNHDTVSGNQSGDNRFHGKFRNKLRRRPKGNRRQGNNLDQSSPQKNLGTNHPNSVNRDIIQTNNDSANHSRQNRPRKRFNTMLDRARRRDQKRRIDQLKNQMENRNNVPPRSSSFPNDSNLIRSHPRQQSFNDFMRNFMEKNKQMNIDPSVTSQFSIRQSGSGIPGSNSRRRMQEEFSRMWDNMKSNISPDNNVNLQSRNYNRMRYNVI